MTPAHSALLVGGLFAVLCLIAAFRRGTHRRLVENLPTSKTSGVFVGLVELKGTAEVHGPPLCSFLTHKPCFHYYWKIEEKFARWVCEDGKIKRETGWETVAKGGDQAPFLLKDDCGSVLVQPEGATIEPLELFDGECSRRDPLYYGKGPAQAIAHSKHRRRFYEAGIPVHQSLYVLGTARERKDKVAPEIAQDAHAPLFLISAWTEDEVRQRFRGRRFKCLAGGLLALIASLLVRDLMTQQVLNLSWPLYVAGLISYAALAVMAWAWMVHNGLLDLRNRVRRAWAEVDVQLQRRHELIPRLVAVIEACAGKEREVQVLIGRLRTELVATPPGAPGPDPHAARNCVRAIAETQPELKTSELFITLQRNLGETEDRIALARGYFNEIATRYNTRLETLPERWIAKLARLKLQKLMGADGFERMPPTIDRAGAPAADGTAGGHDADTRQDPEWKCALADAG